MIRRGRRKRSNLTTQQAQEKVAAFSQLVLGFVATSDVSNFLRANILHGDSSRLCVSLLINGNFETASDFFEAIRVLGEFKLPAKEPT